MTFSTALLQVILSLGLSGPSHISSDLKCLSEAVFFESGSEPNNGKIAVVNVILNRVEDPAYPDTICGVVQQQHQFSYRTTHRFKNGRFDLDKPRVRSAVEDAVSTAFIALNYGFKDNTGEATHFLNPKIAKRTRWAKTLTKTTRIGNHVFYRNRK